MRSIIEWDRVFVEVFVLEWRLSNRGCVTSGWRSRRLHDSAALIRPAEGVRRCNPPALISDRFAAHQTNVVSLSGLLLSPVSRCRCVAGCQALVDCVALSASTETAPPLLQGSGVDPYLLRYKDGYNKNSGHETLVAHWTQVRRHSDRGVTTVQYSL